MINQNKKLKVGLIVDSEFASKYIYELAAWGQLQDNLLISNLIIQHSQEIKEGLTTKALKSLKKNGFLYLADEISFALVKKFEGLALRRFKKKYSDHLKSFNLKNVISETIEINPINSKSDFVYRYSDEDIQKIRFLNLDVLIRSGPGILGEEILRSSKFGVLSFGYGDTRIKRGGSPGFWEVYFKHDKTGFIIQHLTGKFEDGNVLFRGSFPTQFFYLLNQASLYTKSNFYMKKLLSDIARNRALPDFLESQPYFNPILKKPTLGEQFIYLLSTGSAILRKICDKFLFKIESRWNVAFTRSDWKTLLMERANRIKNLPNHFLADPFLITEGNRDYCFVEDYDFKKARGCISVYEIKDKTAERLGEAITEPFHMSFPYLFRFDSKIYMCPETAASREIRLYECVNFPLEWKMAHTLISNISAVDSMIFEWNGLWWLFTNFDPSDCGDYCSELFIFYSDDPTSRNWHPHPKNPIFTDSSKARNAGILYDDKFIYRVSQKQGFGTYGKGFSINKISLLNREEYLESELVSIEPNFFPNIRGTHHLHSNGRISVFDYVQRTSINK